MTPAVTVRGAAMRGDSNQCPGAISAAGMAAVKQRESWRGLPSSSRVQSSLSEVADGLALRGGGQEESQD